MKHAKRERVAFLVPAVEVIVRVGEAERAAVAFYPTGTGTWDVLAGCATPSERGSLISTLRYAADALEQAAFSPGGSARDENDGHEPHGDDDLPF